MRIFLRLPTFGVGDQLLELNVDDDATVAQTRQTAFTVASEVIHKQHMSYATTKKPTTEGLEFIIQNVLPGRLIVNGRVLTNCESTKLVDLGMQNGDSIHLVKAPQHQVVNNQSASSTSTNASEQQQQQQQQQQQISFQIQIQTTPTNGAQQLQFNISPQQPTAAPTATPQQQQQQPQQQQQHAEICQLAAAVRSGDEAEASALLSRGVNALAIHSGMSLLQIAAVANNASMIGLLFPHFRTQSAHLTNAYFASSLNLKYAALRKLIELGINANLRNINGDTVLFMLAHAGADADGLAMYASLASGMKPYESSTSTNDSTIVASEVLCAHQLSGMLLQRDTQGSTALIRAILADKQTTVRALLRPSTFWPMFASSSSSSSSNDNTNSNDANINDVDLSSFVLRDAATTHSCSICHTCCLSKSQINSIFISQLMSVSHHRNEPSIAMRIATIYTKTKLMKELIDAHFAFGIESALHNGQLVRLRTPVSLAMHFFNTTTNNATRNATARAMMRLLLASLYRSIQTSSQSSSSSSSSSTTTTIERELMAYLASRCDTFTALQCSSFESLLARFNFLNSQSQNLK